MKPFVTELNETDPLRAFSAVHHLPYALLLDSADRDHPNARYSYILYNPVLVVETRSGPAYNCIPRESGDLQSNLKDPRFRGEGNKRKALTLVKNLAGERRYEENPFTVLEQQLEAFGNIPPLPGLPPFQGGAAGLFGYDLGRYLEKLPDTAQGHTDMPDMAVGIYDQVLAYDHLEDKTWLITHAADEAEANIKKRLILRALEETRPAQEYKPTNLDWESNMDADTYEQAIATVLDYIYAGEFYQANIAQRFEATLPEAFDPFVHYTKLRTVNPAPYASYFNLGNIQISSASPEQFLSVKDRAVTTKPIKGTRPRAGDDMLDDVYKQELLSSEKDRAENLMIVDLMRNDLSKSCTDIHVSKLCALESFTSVHHLVSSVHGVLDEDKGPVDLLRGCFPGGSITGAPKIRAQEVIEEIEGTRRGAYCGSIGYIGFDGTMDSSILIRTLVYQDGGVSLSVGSGIVADSNADDEYQECFDKADAMFRSFNALDYEIEEDYLSVMDDMVAAE